MPVSKLVIVMDAICQLGEDPTPSFEIVIALIAPKLATSKTNESRQPELNPGLFSRTIGFMTARVPLIPKCAFAVVPYRNPFAVAIST